MNQAIKMTLLATVTLLLTAHPLLQNDALGQATQKNQPAAAEASLKPAAVVSIASMDELLNDAVYLTEAANMADAGRTIAFMAGAFTAGLDKTKPAGVYVTVEAGFPNAIGFVPVKNLQMILTTFRDQLGEPKKLDNGVLQVGAGPTMFIKEQDGWAFIAQAPGSLVDLPKQPDLLLDGLNKEYDVAVRVYVQNIPEEFRKMAVEEITRSYKSSLQQAGGAAADRKLVEAVGANSLKELTQLIEDLDQVTLGWAIDPISKNTFIDFSMNVIEGSELAKKMAAIGKTQSEFVGFLMKDAAVTMNFASAIPDDQKEQTQLLIRATRERTMNELDNDNGLGDEAVRGQLKELVGVLFDTVSATIESGKMDGGGALLLEKGKLHAVVGGHIANGDALNEALAKVVELGRNEPNFPKVELNAASHGGVALHRISIPLPEDEEEARRLLGEKALITIGISKESAFLAIGERGEELIKRVIDANSHAHGEDALAGQLNIAVAKVVQFAATIEQNPLLNIVATSTKSLKESDQISIKVRNIERGAAYRIQVDAGALKILGEAFKAAQGGAGAPF